MALMSPNLIILQNTVQPYWSLLLTIIESAFLGAVWCVDVFKAAGLHKWQHLLRQLTKFYILNDLIQIKLNSKSK